jgi:hypothetical protein
MYTTFPFPSPVSSWPKSRRKVAHIFGEAVILVDLHSFTRSAVGGNIPDLMNIYQTDHAVVAI